MRELSNQIRFLIAMVIGLASMEHGFVATVVLIVTLSVVLLVFDLVGDYLSGRSRR